jgi:hypothetical protein
LEKYARSEPGFALCGLNCRFCPRFHTDGSSRCPGCGGEDFALKHPSCGVIGCAKKHGGVEFCFQCEAYPCPRYDKYGKIGEQDSFVSYRNVLADMDAAKADLRAYLKKLEAKGLLLAELLKGYNDGRAKSFFCNAANLLPLPSLEKAMGKIREAGGGLGMKEKAKLAAEILRAEAEEKGIDLKLRK